MPVGLEPWTLSSPAEREAIFLSHPVRSTSPPAARRFPSPPSAASAAGGEGNLGPRRVHSVGFARVVVGGVKEAVARRTSCVRFAGGLFLSGFGVRWSVVVECRPARARGPPGSPCTLIPFQISPRRIWSTSLKQLEVNRGDDGDGARRRLSGVRGPKTSRPLGDLLPSKVNGEGAAARHRHVSLLIAGVDLQEDLVCNFFVRGDPLCSTLM